MRGVPRLLWAATLAMGTGLYTFGGRFAPLMEHGGSAFGSSASTAIRYVDQQVTASVAGGVGISLMVLGALGMLMLLGDRIAAAASTSHGDGAAATVAIIAIWFSTMVILTFGGFHPRWMGGLGAGVMIDVSVTGAGASILSVAIVCGAAVACSAMAYGWRPWLVNHRDVAESAGRQFS